MKEEPQTRFKLLLQMRSIDSCHSNGRKSESHVFSSTKVNLKFLAISLQAQKARLFVMEIATKIWNLIFQEKRPKRWQESLDKWLMKIFGLFVFYRDTYLNVAIEWNRMEGTSIKYHKNISKWLVFWRNSTDLLHKSKIHPKFLNFTNLLTENS